MELEALEIVKNEFLKIKERYNKKAAKEREKINDVYVTVCDEKCYSEQEINEWYACDYITDKQACNFIEKLKKKKAAAGEMNCAMSRSEMICMILDNNILNVSQEIHDIKVRQKAEQDKAERLKIAQAQGLSYKQFLELEEVSRQSEEFEKLMGIN